MKNDKCKVYEVTVKVITDIPIQVVAFSEEDARNKLRWEVINHNDGSFLRENASDFIHNSYFDDYDFWQTSEVKDKRDYNFYPNKVVFEC